MFTHKEPKNPKEQKMQAGKNKSKKSKAMEKAVEAAMELRNNSMSLGSYTGMARDGDMPEQDADDL